MSISRQRVGLVSLGVGLAAAGVGAAVGLTARRLNLGGPLLHRDRGDRDGERFGTVRGSTGRVQCDDGTEVHVEVDEPAREPGADDAGVLTVVFCHGYSLTLDSWHYQRLALRGRHRLVLWDQRGHGRSASGPAGSSTIEQVGRDLGAVIDAVAPEGPLVLVGHSMGGMTVMSLAHRRPELFAQRVVGVALLSTSAAGLSRIDFGIMGFGRVLARVAPRTAPLLSRTSPIIERGRRLSSELEAAVVRRYSYSSAVSPELVRFTARMIAGTRVQVISDFLPTFGTHDEREALAAMDGLELLVLVGERDLLIPAAHSEEIVRLLPGAELVIVPDAGHLVLLEHPGQVTGHLERFLGRAARAHPAVG